MKIVQKHGDAGSARAAQSTWAGGPCQRCAPSSEGFPVRQRVWIGRPRGIDSLPVFFSSPEAWMPAAEAPVWNRCLRQLEAEVPEQLFNVWVRPLQAIEEGRTLKLLAPNRFVVDWVRESLLERIGQRVGSPEVRLEVGRRPMLAPSGAAAQAGPARPFPPLNFGGR